MESFFFNSLTTPDDGLKVDGPNMHLGDEA